VGQPGFHRLGAQREVRVGDITFLPLATGTNLYLATVIDCCSRRLDDRRILRIENLHTTQPQLRIWHQ
jgi:transposase InsO family protein